MKEFDIFLSYSSRDRELADKLYSDLCEYGLRVWQDQMEVLVGHNILDSIYDGIRGSQFFAILLSKHSVKSNYVKLELDRAKIKSIEQNGSQTILPILAQNVEIPEALIGYKYANIIDDYVFGLNEILNAVIKKTPERRLILQIRNALRTEESFQKGVNIKKFIKGLLHNFTENKIDILKNAGWIAYDYVDSDSARVSDIVYSSSDTFIKRNWYYSNISNSTFNDHFQLILSGKAAADIYYNAYISILKYRRLYTKESMDEFVLSVRENFIDSFMNSLSINLRSAKHSENLIRRIKQVVMSINSIEYDADGAEFMKYQLRNEP